MIEEQECGVTHYSKEFIVDNILRIGTPQKVILSNKHLFPNTDVMGYSVDIIGTDDTIRVHGFTWGYGGEGSHGTLWLLCDILDQEIDIRQIARIPMLIPEFTIELNPKQINAYVKGILTAKSCYECPCLVEDKIGKYCYHKNISPEEIKSCNKKELLTHYRKIWLDDFYEAKKRSLKQTI